MPYDDDNYIEDISHDNVGYMGDSPLQDPRNSTYKRKRTANQSINSSHNDTSYDRANDYDEDYEQDHDYHEPIDPYFDY